MKKRRARGNSLGVGATGARPARSRITAGDFTWACRHNAVRGLADDADLQHTPLPTEVFTQPNDPSKDVRPDTNKIAQLIRSQNDYHQPKSARDALEQYNMQAPTADPEEHIACVDFTFFFATHPEVEDVISEYRAGTGSWARVGTYMRYRTEWEEVAAEYARRAFGLSHGEEVPPVRVHPLVVLEALSMLIASMSPCTFVGAVSYFDGRIIVATA